MKVKDVCQWTDIKLVLFGKEIRGITSIEYKREKLPRKIKKIYKKHGYMGKVSIFKTTEP